MNIKGLMAMLAAATMVVLPQASSAAKGFSYTYVDAGYRGIYADSIDADGVQFNLSVGMFDHFFALASYGRLWQDKATGFDDVDVDIDEFKIGGGGHWSLTDNFDLVGSIVYVRDNFTGKAIPPGETSKSRIKGNNEGFEAAASGRWQAMDKLELTPLIVYRDVGSQSDTGFGADVIYNFHKKWSFRGNATYFSDDSATNLFLGVRLDM